MKDLLFYKTNAKAALLTRKHNVFDSLHYKRKRKLYSLLIDYKAAIDSLNEFDLDTILANEILPTTIKSFCRHGDINNLSRSILLQYIRNRGTPLDVQAMDLTEQFGIQISEEDIYQFMIAHPRGRKTFYKFQELETVKQLIKDLMKFNATPDLISFLKNKIEPKTTSSAPF